MKYVGDLFGDSICQPPDTVFFLQITRSLIMKRKQRGTNLDVSPKPALRTRDTYVTEKLTLLKKKIFFYVLQD